MAQQALGPARPYRDGGPCSACSTPTAGPGLGQGRSSGSSSSSSCSATSRTGPTTSRSTGRSTSASSSGRRSTSARPSQRDPAVPGAGRRAHPVARRPTEPVNLALPEPRTDGAASRSARTSCTSAVATAETAQSTVYVAQADPDRQLRPVGRGPGAARAAGRRERPRRGGSVYVIGGLDADGESDRHGLRPEPERADRRARRMGSGRGVARAARAARRGRHRGTADGLLVLGGGTGPDGVSGKTWKAAFNAQGTLEEWTGGRPAFGRSDRRDDRLDRRLRVAVRRRRRRQRPVATIQRGEFGTAGAAEACRRTPTRAMVVAWSTSDDREPARRHGRTPRAGRQRRPLSRRRQRWDGPQPRSTGRSPTTTGDIPEWKHLDVSDLPAAGLEGAPPVVTGPNAVLVGGTTTSAKGRRSWPRASREHRPAGPVLPARPGRRDRARHSRSRARSASSSAT